MNNLYVRDVQKEEGYKSIKKSIQEFNNLFDYSIEQIERNSEVVSFLQNKKQLQEFFLNFKTEIACGS